MLSPVSSICEKLNNNLIQLSEYISNENILSKNYVVAGDIIQAIQQQGNNPELFELNKQKLLYLAN